MITTFIVAAEVAFWVVLASALTARYVLSMTRLSTVLLIGLPLVDVVLLALVAVDLARGATPASSHALAACYLGFTVAFGHSVVAWADRRVAHLVRHEPLPAKPGKGSAEYVRGLWIEWRRVVVAAAIAIAVLALLSVVSGQAPVPPSIDAASENPLWGQMLALVGITGIWFLAGPAFARRDSSIVAERE